MEISTENRVYADEEGYCETTSVFQAFFHIEIESLDWYRELFCCHDRSFHFLRAKDPRIKKGGLLWLLQMK